MKFGVKKIFSKKNMIGAQKGAQRTAGKIGVKGGTNCDGCGAGRGSHWPTGNGGCGWT